MRLRPITDRAFIKALGKPKYHDLQRVVLDFWESNSNVSEVEVADGEYTHMHSLQSGLGRAIKRLGVNVRVHSFKGKVYLVKDE